MTNPERALLLTVARILRAQSRSRIYPERKEDLRALDDALAPFETRRDDGNGRS